MKKNLYEDYTCNVCGKKFNIKWYMKNISKKTQALFWFLVEDIKIFENFYKIQKFLRLSWASVITHKDLLHLIVWM